MSKSAFDPGGDARVLLDSARDDAPPAGGFERELARHGLEAAGAVVGAGATSAATSPSVTSGAEGAAKLSFPTQLFAVLGALGISGALVFELGFRQDSAPAKTTSSTVVSTRAPSPSLPSREGAPGSASAEVEGDTSRISVSDLPNAPIAARGSGVSSASTARVPSPAAEPSSGSLAEEIAALDRARAAIARSPNEALALLDAHARRYPKTPFRAEAALVRVEALLSAGRRLEAEGVAEPYLREQGDAPVVRRMQRQLDGTSTRSSKP